MEQRYWGIWDVFEEEFIYELGTDRILYYPNAEIARQHIKQDYRTNESNEFTEGQEFTGHRYEVREFIT